ncbi:MAG: hypothetical protein ABSH10_02265 [Phycisphaerae bacterium]
MVWVRATLLLILAVGLAAGPAAAQNPPPPQPATAPAEVDDLIRQAGSAAVDPAQRDVLLAQAVRQMQDQLHDALAHPAASPADVLGRLNLEVKIAETEALLRGGPYATRLLHLEGDAADRQHLAELAAGAMKRLKDVSAEIDGKLVVWRGDYRNLVTAVPALESLQTAVAYKTAWAALYRGLAMEDGPERNALLDEAVALAQPFTEVSAEGADNVARPWSLLLVGIAYRERGAHGRAAAALQEAAAFPSADLRAEVRFQTIRNLIEHGLQLWQAGQAEAARQQWKAAEAALQAAEPLTDELGKALLAHSLYQATAQAAESPEARQEQGRKAQEALMSFVKAHPQAAVQSDFLEIVAAKYRSVQDRGTLGPVVLLALAVTARPGASSAPAASDGQAMIMLHRVIAGGDEASAALRPAAMWHLATMEVACGERRQAAELFAELARKYGDSFLARPAALNAVICYSDLLHAEGQGAGPNIDSSTAAKVHEGFRAALEMLLSRWGKQADVAGWNLDLGWQYEAMAQAAAGDAARKLEDQALAAYQAVPASDPRHVQAVCRAMNIQARRVLEGSGDDPARAKQAAAMVEALHRCAAEAASAGAGRETADVGAWADLTAAKLLADVLGRRDEAMALLADLPARWPGSNFLGQAVEFQAAKLLEAGQPAQAVAAVESLGKDHPDQAQALGRRILEEMYRRGGAASAPSSAGPPPWAAARLRLAEYLYRRCGTPAGGENAAFRYAYAQALLDAGKASEAAELLLACRKQAEEAADRQRGQIDSEVKAKLAAVEAARGDVAKLRAMAAALLAEMDAAGLKPHASRGGWAVGGALAALDGAVAPDQQQHLVDQLAAALSQGYHQLGEARKQAVAAPGDILLDLARAYSDMGRFEEAAQLYGRLAEGLDTRRDPAAYWAAELGYCRSILAARRQDKRAMKSLVVRIAQLKQQDPSLGNLAGQFEDIEAQAAQAGE